MSRRGGVLVFLALAVASLVTCGSNPVTPSETCVGCTGAGSSLPARVLAPVFGPLVVTFSNQRGEGGFWEFDQHRAGSHRPGGGIAGSDDTYAWDVNLYCQGNPTAGVDELVYPVADGEVVRYGEQVSPVTDGSILIAHPNAIRPTWWSAYLHLTDLTVTLNQRVFVGDRIGRVRSPVPATGEQFTFVVYGGSNAPGQLVSFNVPIEERRGPECVTLNVAPTGLNTVLLTGDHYTPGGTVRLFGVSSKTLGAKELASADAASDGTINATRTLDCARFNTDLVAFFAIDVATWLRGDFDANGIVDGNDYGRIATFMASRNTSLIRMPFATDDLFDLDGDGKTESSDSVIVQSLYGLTGPDDRRSPNVQRSLINACGS